MKTKRVNIGVVTPRVFISDEKMKIYKLDGKRYGSGKWTSGRPKWSKLVWNHTFINNAIYDRASCLYLLPPAESRSKSSRCLDCMGGTLRLYNPEDDADRASTITHPSRTFCSPPPHPDIADSMQRFHPSVLRYAVEIVVPLLALPEPAQRRDHRHEPLDTLPVELDPCDAPTPKDIERSLEGTLCSFPFSNCLAKPERMPGR